MPKMCAIPQLVSAPLNPIPKFLLKCSIAWTKIGIE